MNKYQKPAELYDGLRLHQNENTGGCSPKVIEALAALRPEQIGFYPPYEAATRACAEYLGVDPDRLSLLNGLDEGIMAHGDRLSAVDRRWPGAGSDHSGSGVRDLCHRHRGPRRQRPFACAPNPDFSFPLERVLAAITADTRVVFLTNPNNPTGVLDAAGSAIRDGRAARCRRAASCLSTRRTSNSAGRRSFRSCLDFPNVVVGRTFSKAFGLAGIRIGAITGHPDALEPIRLAVPVYSVNIAAVAAVQAALEDRAHLQHYLRAGRSSRRRCSTRRAIGSG